MIRCKRVSLGVFFLLAGVLILGLVACGEYPGVPRQGQQAAQQPMQVAQLRQQSAQSAEQAQPAAPAAESASATGGGEGGGGLAEKVSQLEGVTAEDVPLLTDVVEVELKDFEFVCSASSVPNIFRVKAGEVTFIFNNTSTHAHNFRITAWDGHENVIYPGPKVGARKKRKVKITLEPGVYYVLCNLSDHEERGMVGKLFVEP